MQTHDGLYLQKGKCHKQTSFGDVNFPSTNSYGWICFRPVLFWAMEAGILIRRVMNEIGVAPPAWIYGLQQQQQLT